MKVLITGATGFVGSHLNEKLVKEGHETFLLVRNEKKAKEFSLKGQFVSGSLVSSGEISWLDQLPQDLDCVIHVAGIVHHSDVNVFYKINSDATTNLFKKLHDKYEKLHFIFISSLAAGGPSTQKLREVSDEDAPVSHYGKSKKVAEEKIQSLNSKFNLSIIRPPMIIGPRDPAILDIFKMVQSRFVPGPGMNFLDKTYSFIYVSDLVELIYKVANEKVSGKFYSSHNKQVSFKEIIETIKEDLKIKKVFTLPIPDSLLSAVASLSTVLPISSRLTKDKVNELVQESWCCSNKEASELGVEAVVDLKEAIHQTRLDYEERGWL